MSLFQNKKNFSLQEHVEQFENSSQFSKDEIDTIISNEKYYPKIFKELFINKESSNFPIKHITDEIELFNPSIYNNVTNYHTPLGDIYQSKILKNPVSNLEILQKRQEIIRNVCHNFSSQIDSSILNSKKSISDTLWFFKNNDDHSDYIYNMMYFHNNYLKFLNSNGLFLTISNAYKIVISPIMTAVSPIVYVIIPFIFMRFMRIKVPFKFFLKLMWEQSGMIAVPFIKNPVMSTVVKWFSKALSVFLYFQNVYSSFMTSKTTLGIVNFFQDKLSKVKDLLMINSNIRDNKTFSNLIGYQDISENFQNIESSDLSNYSIISDKGHILKNFYEFIENKNDFLKILNNIGFIDCYFGIAKLIKEKSYFTIPKLIGSEKPVLKINGIWHPAILKEKNVKNDIEFDENKRNYLLTGPNAAGKSTFIKSIFLNIYLSQTMGICNSENMEITPFCYLLTGIRNQDSQGAESLFEAEVHKIRDYLEKIKELSVKGKTFSILDEIFTSTNYQEGFSASYGLCKTIGNIPNSLHIVASHYTNLYKLEKKKDLGFKNIRFSVLFDNEKIIFPYKLENGYSKQFIALKLMKNKNCNDVFIENCINCLEKINKPKKKKKAFNKKKKILEVDKCNNTF